MKKRFLSVLLVITMFATLSPAFTNPAIAANYVTTSDVQTKLSCAETKWKNGAVYDDSNVLCEQCFAFIRELFYYIYGVSLPSSWSAPTAKFGNGKHRQNVTEIAHLDTGYSLQDIQSLLLQAAPGDVLVATNGRTNHGVIIRSIENNGSGIHVYDANWDHHNGIRTYSFWSADGIRRNKPVAVTLYRYVNYIVTDESSSTDTTTISGSNSGNTSPTLNYWDCNTIISCFDGKTVNLYNNPGDSSRVTYFSRGQTAKSTRGATLGGDSIWYSVTVKHNGSDRLLWLKYDGNKMTYTDIEEKPVNQYNVILDNGTACRQITVTNGGTYGDLGSPTRDGYTFDGWYTKESGGSKITSSTTVNLTSDQTLYAHWTKVAHTEHTKGDYIISSDHPHYIFYTCPVCGEVFSDGTTTSVDSCEICNPKEPVDTGHWGNWSSWSTNSVYESGTREVETRTVKVSDGYTEYRYGRYIDGTGGHVGWCATYLANKGYSGITIQYSDWTTSRYSTSGKGWTCGSCNGNHVGVDHYGSDGRAWWADYTSPRSGSFFWEESRTVGAGYETQYRYRDWISG